MCEAVQYCLLILMKTVGNMDISAVQARSQRGVDWRQGSNFYAKYQKRFLKVDSSTKKFNSILESSIKQTRTFYPADVIASRFVSVDVNIVLEKTLALKELGLLKITR